MTIVDLQLLIDAGYKSCAIMQGDEVIAFKAVDNTSLKDEKRRDQVLRVGMYIFDLLLKEAANFDKKVVRNTLILDDSIIVISRIANNTMLIAHSNLDEKEQKLKELEGITEKLKEKI